MAQRTFTVLVEWEDGDVFDADEVVIEAKSAAEAKRSARAAWSATNGAKYPHIRIAGVSVFTERMMRSLA